MKSDPTHWRTTTLEEVTRHKSGNSKLIKGTLLAERTQHSYPAFSATGQDVWRDGFECEGEAIIISAVGARCGKCFLADGKWSAIANTHIVWAKDKLINHRYLWYIINDENYWVKGGSAQPFVKVRASFDRNIAIPPVEEQQRIVAKLDSLFARSRATREELARVPRLVERYKEAILKDAVSGKLTADWRVGRGVPVWREAPIKEVSDVVTGFTPSTKERSRFFGGTTPFFKPTDLDAGYNVDQAREHLTDDGVSIGRLVPAGATLVTCIGATIGKTGFARVNCCTNQQINAVIPNRKFLNNKWLYWMIVSPSFQDAILSNSSATTLPIINKGRFQSLRLSIPSLEEQAEIVVRLEDKFSHIDKLAQETSRATAFLERLEKATLAKAFRGELLSEAGMLATS